MITLARLTILGVVPAAVAALLALGKQALHDHVNEPLRRREVITASENITYTKLGEPIKFETFVWVSTEEYNRVVELCGDPFDLKDQRVHHRGASEYLREDRFRYYYDKGVLKNDP